MSSRLGSCISGSKLASVLLSESWYTFSNYVQNIISFFFAFCVKMSHFLIIQFQFEFLKVLTGLHTTKICF
jgi:hypothetical protein